MQPNRKESRTQLEIELVDFAVHVASGASPRGLP
jgi:hypothetical protein